MDKGHARISDHIAKDPFWNLWFCTVLDSVYPNFSGTRMKETCKNMQELS